LSEPLVNYIGIDVCSESWEDSDLKKTKCDSQFIQNRAALRGIILIGLWKWQVRRCCSVLQTRVWRSMHAVERSAGAAGGHLPGVHECATPLRTSPEWQDCTHAILQ